MAACNLHVCEYSLESHIPSHTIGAKLNFLNCVHLLRGYLVDLVAEACQKEVKSLLDSAVELGVESRYECCSFSLRQHLRLLTELINETFFIQLRVIFFGPISVKDVQIGAGNLLKHGRRGF